MKKNCLFFIFFIYCINIFPEVLKSRYTFSIYKNSNLFGYVVEINDRLNDKYTNIYLLKNNFDQYIIIKMEDLAKNMEQRKAFWEIKEEIKDIKDKEVQKQREDELKKEYKEFLGTIKPWEMEIYDNSNIKKYYISGISNFLCIEEETKKYCENEMIDFISKHFSDEIRQLLYLWNCYEYYTTYLLLQRPIECITSNFEVKEEFVNCILLEGKLEGFNCEDWENAKTEDNVQMIIRDNKKHNKN